MSSRRLANDSLINLVEDNDDAVMVNCNLELSNDMEYRRRIQTSSKVKTVEDENPPTLILSLGSSPTEEEEEVQIDRRKLKGKAPMIQENQQRHPSAIRKRSGGGLFIKEGGDAMISKEMNVTTGVPPQHGEAVKTQSLYSCLFGKRNGGIEKSKAAAIVNDSSRGFDLGSNILPNLSIATGHPDINLQLSNTVPDTNLELSLMTQPTTKVVDPTFKCPKRLKQITSDAKISNTCAMKETEKSKEDLVSQCWISRWLKKPQSESLEKKRIPSVAAMALMGKIMEKNQPYQIQKRANYSVWY